MFISIFYDRYWIFHNKSKHIYSINLLRERFKWKKTPVISIVWWFYEIIESQYFDNDFIKFKFYVHWNLILFNNYNTNKFKYIVFHLKC